MSNDARALRTERLAFNLLQLFTIETMPDDEEECSMDEALDTFIEALKGYDSRHENELTDPRVRQDGAL